MLDSKYYLTPFMLCLLHYLTCLMLCSKLSFVSTEMCGHEQKAGVIAFDDTYPDSGGILAEILSDGHLRPAVCIHSGIFYNWQFTTC